MASELFQFQLSSLAQLDLIDKLRDLGVSNYLALPQLVVVGDQSSGKSSVLEAISGLPFARDSGLCTRFATQITMRRTDSDSITISIIPDAVTSAEKASKLQAFKKEGLSSLHGLESLAVFEEACKVMNISSPGQALEAGQMTFSNEVLKIELCGPSRENLSIIGIPGIFRTPTLGVTTKADMLLVESMSYQLQPILPRKVSQPWLKKRIRMSRAEYPEVDDLFSHNPDMTQSPTGNILEWIEREYKKARGRNLESIGPAVLPNLWQQQSKNWEVITLNYFKDVINYVHNFICKLLSHVCLNDRIRNRLCLLLLDLLLDRYQEAINNVKFVIKVERFGTPLTLNDYFSDGRQKFRMKRIQKKLENIAQDKYSRQGQHEGKFIKLESIATAVSMDNVEHTILDIHSILRAYYKVARKRFVDTVCMQGTDYHLLSGDDSPLRIFSAPFVSSLTNEQLESIAGEEPSSKRLRKALKLEIKALEDGKKLLRTL